MLQICVVLWLRRGLSVVWYSGMNESIHIETRKPKILRNSVYMNYRRLRVQVQA